jgi:hypothetical protein
MGSRDPESLTLAYAAPVSGEPEKPSAPFSAVGAESAPVCQCGSGPHPELEGRCAAGHVTRGNGLALVVGQHSAAFWAAEADARREIRQDVIADQGHTEADAPRPLAITAETIAQATLIRDSAYLRMAESGGPLSASGRTRRSFKVWCEASDRLQSHLRLVGLRRMSRPIDIRERLATAARQHKETS